MKTILDIPDTLLNHAKEYADQENTTLEDLVSRGLELALKDHLNPPSKFTSSPLSDDAAKYFEISPLTGIPRLKDRGVVVTREMVDTIREEEGI